MVRVIKLIKDFGKDLASEKHWLAAEYNYLTEVRELLQEAARQLVSGNPLRPVKEALRDLRQVGRSQRRVSRFERHRKNDLKELMRVLPQYAQDFFNHLEQEMEIAEAHLTKGSSLFIGDLREKIERITLDLGVLEKLMRERTPDLTRITHFKGVIREEILDFEKHLAEMIKWVGALSVDLEKEEAEERKLEKMAA
jgi:hypothetical protein